MSRSSAIYTYLSRAQLINRRSSADLHVAFFQHLYLALYLIVSCTVRFLKLDMNQLFVGRLPRGCRNRDLEDIFYKYGEMTRCDVKTGGYYL